MTLLFLNMFVGSLDDAFHIGHGQAEDVFEELSLFFTQGDMLLLEALCLLIVDLMVSRSQPLALI